MGSSCVGSGNRKKQEYLYVVAYREFWEPVGVAEILEQG